MNGPAYCPYSWRIEHARRRARASWSENMNASCKQANVDGVAANGEAEGDGPKITRRNLLILAGTSAATLAGGSLSMPSVSAEAPASGVANVPASKVMLHVNTVPRELSLDT